MNVLVTGGAGFIGSHLVERLIRDGCNLTVLDNFITSRRENLAHIKSRKLLTVKIDIGNRKQNLTKYFRKIDWVFHLAALADIVPSMVKPIDYHRSNVDGTVAVLEASRKAHVKRFIYSASASCYGIPHTYPTSETAPIKPQYPYALTKYIGEQYILHWGQVYKLPVVSLRFFNVYGPRSRTTGTYGAVFGTFLAQKLSGRPFTVVGDGTQSRDFIFVTDAVSALVTAAKSATVNEIFNVGSGKPKSVNRLVKLLRGPVVYIPKRPGEPVKTQADISKIKTCLGWRPKISFETGVTIMLKHIDYWKNAPVWTPETIKTSTRAWFHYLS